MEKAGNHILEAEMKDAFPPPIYRACSVFSSLLGVVGEVVTFSLIWQIIASDCDYIHPLATRLFGASDDRLRL